MSPASLFAVLLSVGLAERSINQWLRLYGWTADGEWLIFDGELRAGGGDRDEVLRLRRVIAADADASRTFRVGGEDPSAVVRVVDRAAWNAADTERDGTAWAAAHAVGPARAAAPP